MERSEWHAELAEILHPAGDLARDSLSYTHEKANDLKEALVTLLKQADATWPVSTSSALPSPYLHQLGTAELQVGSWQPQVPARPGPLSSPCVSGGPCSARLGARLLRPHPHLHPALEQGQDSGSSRPTYASFPCWLGYLPCTTLKAGSLG